MKVLIFLLISLVFLEASEITLADMKKEKRVAFVIENVDYEGLESGVKIDKVSGIKEFLEKNGFTVIYQNNANRADTIRGFRSFNVSLKDAGVALFYFKGHAVQVTDNNYFLPANILSHGGTNIEKILSVNAIIGVMNKAHSRVNMLIIDSVNNKKLLQELNIKKEGLAELHVGSNTNLIISSKTNSTRRSQYITTKIQKIFEKKGLSSKEGFSKFKYANKESFVKLSKQDFYFKLPSKLISTEDKVWLASFKSSSLASFALYLKKYPKGKYTNNARKAIKKIDIKNAKIAEIKAQKIAELKVKKDKQDKQAKFDEEVKKQVALALNKIKKVEVKEIKLIKVSKPIAVVKENNLTKPKYKKSFYIEPEMVEIIQSDKNFSIGKYEVTNKEYKAFLKATQNNKNLLRYDRRSDEPVVNITFKEAQAYAVWLSAMSDKRYSLPTEKQWEYAARAGTDTNYFWGNRDVSMKKAFWLRDSTDNAHLYAWIKSDSENSIHNIGEKEQNPWGLYDIYGNASEWCINENKDAQTHALRGGSFLSSSKEIKSMVKVYKKPLFKSNELGFRLVKEIK